MFKPGIVKSVLFHSEYQWYNVALLFLFAGYTISTVFFPFMGHDSGFYLKYALDFYNGLSYFHDFNVAYTPLSMYILSLVYYIFPEASLYLFYTVITLLYVFCGFLFLQILRNFGIEQKLTVVMTSILVVALFVYDGANIQLEPFVLIFQLISILLFQKWIKTDNLLYLFGTGFNCFLAFYAKQYGLFILIGYAWYFFANRNEMKERIKSVLIFLAGFMIPVLFLLVQFYFHELNPSEMFVKIAGIEVLKGNEVITGIGYDVFNLVRSLFRSLIEVPVLILIFPLSIKYAGLPKLKDTMLIFCIATGSLLQLLFAGYRHYYQLIGPYMLILMALMFRDLSAQTPWLKKWFKILIIAFIIISAGNVADRFNHRIKRLKRQNINAELLLGVLPRGEKVYLQGVSPAYYYLCRYNSADFKTLGYRFPEEFTPAYLSGNLPEKSFIITDTLYRKLPEFQSGYTEITRLMLAEKKEIIILRKD
jgi:hypothetical protein